MNTELDRIANELSRIAWRLELMVLILFNLLVCTALDVCSH
jgi:hypothetical protein